MFLSREPLHMIGGREFHAYLATPKGIERARFMGPGTSVLERIRRGDQPVSGADKVAQAHDLRYTLAQGDKAKERAADIKMINKLQDPSVDNMLNRAIGRIPIKAKVAAEKLGILSAGNFSKGDALNDEETDMVETKLNELEQEGFGKPGSRLRSLLKQRGGALPPVPPNLPVGISQQTIDQIRNVAMALGMPERTEEWLNKQNVLEWYQYMGVPEAEAMAATFGDERPWDGVVNQGVARASQVVERGPSKKRRRMEEEEEDAPFADYSPAKQQRMQKKASTKKRTVSKEAFLERMAEGRRKAAAKRKRAGTTKKKPTKKKKKLTAAKKRTVGKKIGKVLKKMGKGLGLAGEGLKLAGEGFHIPDGIEDYQGVAKHLADHVKGHFRITMPEPLIGALGEEMSGMGMDWNNLQGRLSGLQTL